MLQPTHPGWKVETVGDDIAWMRFGEDGRLYAINPEAGFFGVAPGTNGSPTPTRWRPSPPATRIFTNVALTDDGDVWWEGMTGRPARAPDRLEGQGLDAARSATPAAHPNSRFTAPRSSARSIAPEWEDPQGVPISAILFGGRRASDGAAGDRGVRLGARRVPGRDHGLGDRPRPPRARSASCAATRSPCCRSAATTWATTSQHWLDVRQARRRRQAAEDLPRQLVPQGRDGQFLWPGFGENSRVLKWIVDRIEHQAGGQDTAIGVVPSAGDLDLDGLDVRLPTSRRRWRSTPPSGARSCR